MTSVLNKQHVKLIHIFSKIQKPYPVMGLTITLECIHSVCFLGLTTVFTFSKVFYLCFSNSFDNRRSHIVNNKRCLVPKLQYRCHSRFHFDTIFVAAILQPFSVYKGTISKKALASHKIGFIFHENTKYWKKNKH